MTQVESREGAGKESLAESTKGKGKAFFQRAEQVAETGNWDFAIEMYIEGIQREPDNVDRGHQPLREVALKRKATGGKGPGMMDLIKRRQGKDPVANLANAEYLLAKNPGSEQYMLQILRAARGLELPATIHWVANILLESQRLAEGQGKKTSRRTLMEITKAFQAVEDFQRAVTSCEMALKQAPNDGELRETLRDLSAQYTIQKGRYEEGEGDFTKGVKDMEEQQKLMRQDALVKDEEFLLSEIKRTRQEYLEAPRIPGKINAVVEALLKIENESYENEAIDVLTKAHQDTGAYQFKMRIGDVKIRQMTRRYRQLRDQGDTAGANEQLQRQLNFELEEYAERAANYPTDLAIKFELGRRQFLTGQLDEMIDSLIARDKAQRLANLSL